MNTELKRLLFWALLLLGVLGSTWILVQRSHNSAKQNHMLQSMDDMIAQSKADRMSLRTQGDLTKAMADTAQRIAEATRMERQIASLETQTSRISILLWVTIPLSIFSTIGLILNSGVVNHNPQYPRRRSIKAAPKSMMERPRGRHTPPR